MTYEQFIQKIKDLKIEINQKTSIDDINEKMFKGDIPPFYEDKKWKMIKPRFDFILQYWNIGGISGGNWTENSNPRSYIENNEPKNFEELDNLLIGICPKITFLIYKKIEQIIQTFEATDYQYYGNRDDYKIRFIKLKDLYNLLLDNNELDKE